MKEKDLGLKFWAAVAVSAVVLGVAIAFVAGFFLGDFHRPHPHHDGRRRLELNERQQRKQRRPKKLPKKVKEKRAKPPSPQPPPSPPKNSEPNPGDNWTTNGGNLTNDRFSSLDEINTENVKELKGDWMTKIGANATAAKFSAEGQALEYEGTIYISDGADDVFAMDASSGEILWTYEPKLPADPLGNVICCGWDNRGVALGDGMVFVSQLNGDQVALDQATGKVKWLTPVVKPGSGYSITSAPLYYKRPRLRRRLRR